MNERPTLLRAFDDQHMPRPPFWFMRQAGRYLPEYRDIRNSCGDFLSLCYSPEEAAEVTLQPLRRFAMDAAIIFSDILVVPHAMGLDVRFEKGEGPRLGICNDPKELRQEITDFLSPVYQAIEKTRHQLPEDTSLIGFVGAPWTLACYMAQGRGGGDFEKARAALYERPSYMEALMDVLTHTVATHLIAQVKSGATVLQIFDSWAGLVPSAWQERAVFNPTKQIVSDVKRAYPNIPVIGFPRGIGSGIAEYARITGVDGIGIDSFTSLEVAARLVPPQILLQGNLDPLLLAASNEETIRQAKKIRSAMRGRKFIFNLGHGIVPHTPVTHVQALSDALRNDEYTAGV